MRWLEKSCFSLSLSHFLTSLSFSLPSSPPCASSPLFHSSPLFFQGRIAFIATNTLWSPRLSAAPASHWGRQSGKQAAKQPGSPPRQENEQFSHCNNAPLSSSHYRHDKRWNIQGGWPPNLIWARYWACGKWVLSALIYSLADWPLKLNIITERIFKKRGHKLHQNENIKEHYEYIKWRFSPSLLTLAYWLSSSWHPLSHPPHQFTPLNHLRWAWSGMRQATLSLFVCVCVCGGLAQK